MISVVQSILYIFLELVMVNFHFQIKDLLQLCQIILV